MTDIANPDNQKPPRRTPSLISLLEERGDVAAEWSANGARKESLTAPLTELGRHRVEGVRSGPDGTVKKWPPMDIDLVSLPVLEDLLKELGYQKYEKLLWHDLNVPDLEFGLHELKGDAGINEMRGAVVMHIGVKEFHIYVQHAVDTDG
ncbi:hypothetical protein PIB30_033473 [Stylosanthes scabra]|uniref:PB1-like domain-containing protein n=1 Tax=Stylosanthes scabra TaxID=79078 RepID=A0ABU6WAJ0_9FABA|nr:hypothetical protein [Stylosanthes scabra]